MIHFPLAMHPECRLRGALAVCAALGLAACAAPPKSADRPVEIEPPAAWTTPAQGDSLSSADWIASFGDTTLEQLVGEALTHNYDLRALAQTLEATRAAATIAKADQLPQVGAGLDAARRQTVIESSGNPIPLITEAHSLGLSVGWEIDLWGRLRDRAGAALADLQAADADLSAARLSLAGSVAKAWFRLLTARQQVNLAEETVRSFDATAELVRNRFDTGIATSLELRLTLANAAAAHALLDQRRAELDSAARTLEVILGRYPAAQIEAANELPTLPAAVPPGLPSELLARRPDIVAAERRLAASDARVLEARKSLLPNLSLTGAGGTASSELHNLLDRDFEVWALAAGLTQPLFQGGRLRANVRRTEAVAERAHLSYLKTVLSAFQEVESGLVAEDSLRRREASLFESATHSAGAERLARDEYEAGLSDIITVLESQRRALDARSSYLSIREQRLRTRVDLHLALGGDFQPAG